MSLTNVTYDPKADAAYFKLRDSKIVDSETSADGIVYDYDANDRVVGIEILSVKKHSPEELINGTLPLSEGDRESLLELFDRFRARPA